jgi:hypothetical protein
MSPRIYGAPVISLIQQYPSKAEATEREWCGPHEAAATSLGTSSSIDYPSSHDTDQKDIEFPSPRSQRVGSLKNPTIITSVLP